MTRHRLWITLAVSLLFSASALSAGFPNANPDYQVGFPIVLDGDRVRSSSTALGDVNGDGVPDIVVGTADGQVHAYTGAGVELWVYDTGDMAIESKAAIADIDGDGEAEVVVGAGSTFTPNAHGGLYVINHLGLLQCEFMTDDDNDPDTFREGVFASPALADLDGNDGGLLEIAFGSWDRNVRVINHDCSEVWEDFLFDIISSSAAIGDINNDSQLDVVVGVVTDDDSPVAEAEGGALHVYNGATGVKLAGFPIQIDEVIFSSPSLGDLNNDGFLEIVVGTGHCWADPACASDGIANPGVGEYFNAWDHTGQYLPGWPVAVPNQYAFAAPTLVDLDNDGDLEVILNSIDPDNQSGGLVYALEADGSAVPGWPVQPTTPAGGGAVVHFSTRASPVVADITGDGNLEVILPSNGELVVWDKDGNQLSRSMNPPEETLQLRSSFSVVGGAAVGDIDDDGDLEVVVGSADAGGTPGVIYAWDFDADAGGKVPWPMFRRSADNQSIVASAIFTDGFESGDTSAWSSSAR